MSPEQKTEVADGVATYDEHQAAFQRMKACVAADGYKIVTKGETNQLINMAIPDAAYTSYTRCYGLEFAFVDSEWQSYRENFGPTANAYATTTLNQESPPSRQATNSVPLA